MYKSDFEHDKNDTLTISKSLTLKTYFTAMILHLKYLTLSHTIYVLSKMGRNLCATKYLF